MNLAKESAHASSDYREQALRSLVEGKGEIACYWKLAADVRMQIEQQESACSILKPNSVPFFDQLASLNKSTQEANYYIEHSSKKEAHWLFSKGIFEEPLSHYRYWIACANVRSSKNFQQESEQVSEVAEKYKTVFPKVAFYAQEALKNFKKARDAQIQLESGKFLHHELVSHFWRSAAYEASHVAHLFFEEQKSIASIADEAYRLRLRAAEAMQEKETERALEYTLAASVLTHGFEKKFQEEENIFLAKEIARQRIYALEQSDGSREKILLKQVVNCLEMALEGSLRATELEKKSHANVAFYWKESSWCLKKEAQFFLKILSKTKTNFISSYFWKRKLKRSKIKVRQRVPLMLLEKIYFCLDEKYLPSHEWQRRWQRGEFVSFNEKNKSLTVHAWIYQTWSNLQQVGVACHLFTQMAALPQQGIVITLSAFLHYTSLKAPLAPNLFLVDIIADEGMPHPAATLHLLPNKTAATYLPFTKWVPHWPQPFLIPRDPGRGTRFEHVCFFGDLQSLAPELSSAVWREELKKTLGLTFSDRGSGEWHDFSDVDCVIAIRDFSHRRYFYKPGSKLHNAWLAGVPFIGGIDSAYAADGKPEHNYLVATSAENVMSHLKRLKEAPALREQLLQNGFQAATSFNKQATVACWKKLLEETIPIRALKWQRLSKVQRSCLVRLQQGSCVMQSLLRKWSRPKKFELITGTREDHFFN